LVWRGEVFHPSTLSQFAVPASPLVTCDNPLIFRPVCPQDAPTITCTGARTLRLDLDFGRGLVAHVDLENVTEDQYAEIVGFFAPMVNDPRMKSRDAIGHAFALATRLCPLANPSDLWHHVIYRTYLREKLGTNPEQSWVRTSGEGFEIALVERYNPALAGAGIRLTSMVSKTYRVAA
jgi:hypothetical protein